MDVVILRPYQTQAYEAVRAEFIAGRTRVVLVSPVGSGKTVMGSYLASRKVSYNGRVVWIAHRTELIDQAYRALTASGLVCGAIAAGSRIAPQPYAPVQVASIQTLVRRAEKPPADLIIWDEVHHQASSTYQQVAQQYPNAQHVGLSATPERADGRPLDWFTGMVTGASYSELLAGGYLVPCEVIAPNRTLKPGEIAQRPVDAYLRHTPGQSALVFSPTVEMAEKHAAEFREAGIDAVCIEGSTARGNRRKWLEEFSRGHRRVITNCGVLTEGTDLPVCSVVVLARGCGSQGLYIQITGRALRPAPGKTGATLLDLRGVSHIHGHPCEDRVYSLDGDQGIRRASEPNPYPACLVCGAPKEPGSVCAECGTQPRQTSLVITGDELSKWEGWRRKPEGERVKSLVKWMRTAREKGHKAGAAHWKFRAVFGSFPTADMKAEAERILRDE